ncbi:tail collar fiber protein [Vibrio phage EniLVp02]
MTLGTNIFKHVSDDASTVNVVTETTVFSSDNLQGCLEELDPHVLNPIPEPDPATDTTSGVVRFATPAETLASSLDNVAITPWDLNYWFENLGQATTAQYGTIRIATDAQVLEGTDETLAITPKSLNWYATNKPATETEVGFARRATQAQAVAGSDNSTIMTPLRVKQCIDAWAVGSDADATTTEKGLIRIATTTEVNDITKDNLAVTPYNLNARIPTATVRAGFKLPDAGVANARTSNEHVLTPGNLSLFAANSVRAGVAKVLNTLTSSDTTSALSAAMGKKLQDEKIGITGGRITGALAINTIETLSGVSTMAGGYFTSRAMLNMYPVGSIYISVSPTNPASVFGGSWSAFGEGRVLIGAGTTQDDRGEYKTFTNGQTGGAYNHLLTEAEMPEHKHAGWGEYQDTGVYAQGLGFGIAKQYGRNNVGQKRHDFDNWLYYSSPVGGSQAHNNMQPYIVVYMWRRTA